MSARVDSTNLRSDEFVRAVGVNKTSPHALFLGAGASVSSGVGAVELCIWDWKRRLFVSNNPGLREFVAEVSSVAVRRRIQTWLDQQGIYPQEGDPSEYPVYAQACYPLPEDRRRYFHELLSSKSPHVGYKLAALLSKSGLIQTAWTTNFDSLLPTAAAGVVTTVEVGLDTTGRADRAPTRGELLHVALHGDFRYDALKNTDNELQQQDERLRAALIERVRSDSLIVLGYSGRDSSIMEALEAGFGTRGSGRLYWCLFGDEEPPSRVLALLEAARRAGRPAFLVRTHGFDDTMYRLVEQCLEGEDRSLADKLWRDVDSSPIIEPFSLPAGAPSEVIKSNAFPMTAPVDVLEIDVARTQGPGLWARMRAAIADKPITAAVSRRKFIGFGEPGAFQDALGALAEGRVRRATLHGSEVGRGEVAGLLRETIVRALAAERQLPSDGRGLLWEGSRTQSTMVDGTQWSVHNAVSVAVRRSRDDLLLAIEPTIVGIGSDGVVGSVEVQRELRRAILARQYNHRFNDDANRWRNLLLPANPTTIRFPAGDAGFEFSFSRVPLYAGIRGPGPTMSVELPAAVSQVIRQDGLRVREPPLTFSRRDAQASASDVHPMRGLVLNRPYDFRVTAQDRDPNVTIAVIAPRDLFVAADAFLNRLNASAKPDSKKEYLLPFPGFSSAFGIALDLPPQGNSRWAVCAEPPRRGGMQSALALAKEIVSCIDRLDASTSFDVLFIVVPKRWKNIESLSTENEAFDLHDFVKAHCVQRGLATQFLREQTFAKPHECEIRWWLALAIYAKSMRTPWLLGDLSSDTAFLGLGFSQRPKIGSEGHIVQGCSHLYNAQGQGLRYRLSRVDHPVFRGRNPFMSYEDARRVGDAARQLLTERGAPLPDRIVVHRRTPYLAEEIEGLSDGLAGVRQLELLEILVEPRLRYVASRIDKAGEIKGDTFPVNRGTTVLLGPDQFLLWAHGSVPALDSERRYFKGSTRIPAPLLVRRYRGNSSLATIAGELLGLSKMNWNSFDMYSQLPATIQSSQSIARIGSLLERFGSNSYDYRLFI